MLVMTSAARAVTSCPNQIISCGCAITGAGDYKITAALSQSANGPFCLELDGPDIRLDLGGNSITGPSSTSAAIGIQLTKHANKAIIVGGGATISGFGEGVEIDDMDAIVSDLKADGNGGGIVLIKARDVQLTKIDASNNTDTGLGLLLSSKSEISNFTANGNAFAGIYISGISDDNRISSFQTNSNGSVGVMITPLHCGSAVDGPACHQRGGRGNYLIGGDASANHQFGILVEKRTSKSTIIGVTATTNTQGDLMDGAPNCDDNLWFGNTFTVASPSNCIH